MAYLEVAKIHPKLGKILELDAEIRSKAAKDYATKQGVTVEDINNMRVPLSLIVGMNRYISTVSANNANKLIPKEAVFQRVNAGGVESEWIYSSNASETKIFFHLFGGGYMMGNLDTRRWSPYLYSKGNNMRCLNIGYRLAPEHPYPAALDDSIAAYKWLLDLDFDPENIILCGESAGGGLTIATMLKLRDLEFPLPAAAVMQSPWVDLRCKGKSIKEFFKYEPELASGVKGMANLYAGRNNKKNPLISPIYADLEGFPPLLIQAGGIEILLDEIVLLAEQAKSSGVDITLEVYEGMTHVFQSFADKLEESINAWKSIQNFVKKNVP